MLKKIGKILLVVILVVSLFFVFPPHFSSTSATDTTFEVNVKEVLSVSITTPSTWASGDVGDFLRNSFILDVTTNNAQGFTAGLATETTNTNLTNTANSSFTISNLSSSTPRSSFNANFWGYSTDDASNSGTYKPLKSSAQAPDTILCSGSSCSGPTGNSSTIYFGTKADISKASGTYTNTVVISVVSSTNGADLEGPVSDTDVENPTKNTATYNENTTGNTTYTYTTGNTTTTQVSEGNNVDAYTGYIPPQGVTDSNSSNIYNGSLLTTMLATTASIAACSGIFFFILAKRKKDDDEEETE